MKKFEDYYGEYEIKKDYVFPFGKIEKGKNIVLYGAGKVGQTYYNQIIASGYANIVAWVDRSAEDYKIIYRRDIKEPDFLKTAIFDYLVVAVEKRSLAREIISDLIKYGISRDVIVWANDTESASILPLIENRIIYPVINQINKSITSRGDAISNETLKKIYDEVLEDVKFQNKLIIPRVVLQITTVCTLKCRNCNNLMQLYDNPKHFDYTVVLEDLHRFLSAIDECIVLEILGGEPFTYPNLTKIIEEVIKIKKIKYIEITTNGTIVPSVLVLETLARGGKKILIRISKYEKSRKIDELVKNLYKYNINCVIMEDMVWTESGPTQKIGRSYSDLINTYAKCPSGYYCKTILSGRLYNCARSASLHDLGYMNESDDYILLQMNNNLRSEIYQLMLQYKEPACDYCYATENWRTVKAGEQTDADKLLEDV